jgi:uncharacterized protein YgfB (UPF0149 family)
MPYSLKTYDGTSLVTIADGLVDDQVTTPLFLIGKNVTGYGTRQNENFLYLLENFAGITPPFPATAGQLWFDKTAGATKLNVNDGAGWKGLAVEVVSTSQPTTLSLGDIWFDSKNKQLWVKSDTGTAFTLVGPDVIPGFGVTKLVAKSVKDINDTNHVILDVTVNDDLLAIFSQDQFSIGGNEAEFAAGFTNIVRGLTLRPGASLSGLDIPSRSNNEVITTQWNFSSGIKLGSSTVSITTDSNRNLILNAVGSNLVVNSQYLLPASATASIGSVTQPFDEITVSNITSGSAIKPLNVLADTVMFTDSKFRPYLDNNIALGTSVGRWKNVYSYGLSAGNSSASGTIEGIWSVAQGSRLITPAIETPELTSGGTALPGTVIGQWALYPGSSWQATQLIDGYGNVVNPDVNATDDTVVLRTHLGQINATQFNGQVVGALLGNSTGTHFGTVIGDVAGNLRATATTSTNIYATMVTATNLYGFLTGPVTGKVTGNVTGNLTGSVISVDQQNTLIDASSKQIGYTGAALVGNVTGNITGNVNSTDGRTVMIDSTAKQIGYADANLKGKLTGTLAGNVVDSNSVVLIDATNNAIGTKYSKIKGDLTGSLTGNVYADSIVKITSSDRLGSGSLYINNTYGSEYGFRTQLDTYGNYIINHQNASGQQTQVMSLDSLGRITATSFSGSVYGHVTGDVTGKADNSVLWNGSNKYVSTSPPTNDQGADGDFWFQREA